MKGLFVTTCAFFNTKLSNSFITTWHLMTKHKINEKVVCYYMRDPTMAPSKSKRISKYRIRRKHTRIRYPTVAPSKKTDFKISDIDPSGTPGSGSYQNTRIWILPKTSDPTKTPGSATLGQGEECWCRISPAKRH